ncbi:MAG: c-type cytochrome [Ectothiorhodospiraceae bacterium]|nr:c-type cytochrome [Ectothiorhodospiraceae bacterium]
MNISFVSGIKGLVLASVLFVLVGIDVTGAIAATAPANSGAETNKSIAALYLKNCAICHGDSGDAKTRARSGMSPKPRDFTTAQAAIELTRERMIKSVTDGRPGTAMVGHKGRLSPQQIDDLVDYIRISFMQISAPAVGESPASVSLGEMVYTKNCSVCHGDTGNTAYWAKSGLNPPPRDFTSPEAQGVLTRTRMVKSVTEGRPGTGMVSFSRRLTGDEIVAVVTYIRFKFMGVDPDNDSGAAPLALVKPVSAPITALAMGAIPGVDMPLSSARSSTTPVSAKPAATNVAAKSAKMASGSSDAASKPGMPGGHSMDSDMSLPVPNRLKGDFAWGRTFYMSNCFVCHGVTGQGDGPRAYFNIPRPRNFTSEASRQILNRPRIYKSITDGRVGTVMPAWSKVLTEQQIAGLTEFVFQTFIQPEPLSNEKADSKKKAP